jgi:hypothetical protein
MRSQEPVVCAGNQLLHIIKAVPYLLLRYSFLLLSGDLTHSPWRYFRLLYITKDKSLSALSRDTAFRTVSMICIRQNDTEQSHQSSCLRTVKSSIKQLYSYVSVMKAFDYIVGCLLYTYVQIPLSVINRLHCLIGLRPVASVSQLLFVLRINIPHMHSQTPPLVIGLNALTILVVSLQISYIESSYTFIIQ